MSETQENYRPPLKTTQKDGDPMAVTCDAFAVLRRPDGRWEPVRLAIEGGIVSGRELVALDAMDYPQLAYIHAGNAMVEHSNHVVDKMVRDSQVCDHTKPAAAVSPRKSRVIRHCTVCKAEETAEGWWSARKAGP